MEKKCPRCNDLGKVGGCSKCGRTVLESVPERIDDLFD
jgi:rRNA maturation protein Nop10